MCLDPNSAIFNDDPIFSKKGGIFIDIKRGRAAVQSFYSRFRNKCPFFGRSRKIRDETFSKHYIQWDFADEKVSAGIKPEHGIIFT